MNRNYTIAGAVLVTIMGAGMFQVKYVVEERDRELDALYRQHLENQKAIRVLEAEWAYLNSPEYLQGLAANHLKVMPTLPGQVVADVSEIPYRRSGAAVDAESSGGGADAASYPVPRKKPRRFTRERMADGLVPAGYGDDDRAKGDAQ